LSNISNSETGASILKEHCSCAYYIIYCSFKN